MRAMILSHVTDYTVNDYAHVRARGLGINKLLTFT